MAREIKQKHEIVDHINGILSCIDEIKHCRISGVRARQDTDDDGCNWTIEHISLNGSDPEIVEPIISGIVDASMKQFNIPS